MRARSRIEFALTFLAAGLCACEPMILDFQTEGVPVTTLRETDAAPPAPEPPVAPEVVVRASRDLSRESSGDRGCADGGDVVAYSVLAAAAAGLVLAQAPSGTCLAPGDEVLLIQLQGAPGATGPVGTHELLRVQGVLGQRVQLVAAPLNAYGTGDPGSWKAPPGQVFLQRVPSYARLTVEAGASLTAAGWGEGGTGVLALRVLGDARIDGSIVMNARGYRGGAERTEALAHGLSGESLAGLGEASTAPNDGGGGGGLGDQKRQGCVQDGTAGGGGGHLLPGGDAVVAVCAGEGRGRGGAAYASATQLFLGSGGGSGGVDNVRFDNPPGAPGGNGGGIIWLLAQSISGSGQIEARGDDGVGDRAGLECEAGGSTTRCYDHSGTGGGGAGGTIRLSAPQISGVVLDASGGRGGNGWDLAGGDGGEGSPGVIDAPARSLE